MTRFGINVSNLPEGKHLIEIVEVLEHGDFPDEWTIIEAKFLDAGSESCFIQLEQSLLPKELSRYDLRPGMRLVLTVEQVKPPTVITKITLPEVAKRSCQAY